MGYIAGAVLGLYNLLNGHAIFTSYGNDLQVILGPPLQRDTPIEVLVGSWGNEAESADGATSLSQMWATMGSGGAAQRDKVITIPCCVWAIGGEADNTGMAERVTTADGVFTAIDTLLTTADLGLGEILCGGVEIREAGVWLGQTTAGAEAAIRFFIQATARDE